MHRFDDVNYLPPADLSGPDARAYEQAIADDLMQSGRDHGWTSVDLEGERPNTVLVIRVSGQDEVRFPLWRSEYPTSGSEEYGFLTSALDVAATIWSDWCSGYLPERVERM